MENKIVWAGVSEFHPNDGVDSLQQIRDGELDIIIQDSNGLGSGVLEKSKVGHDNTSREDGEVGGC